MTNTIENRYAPDFISPPGETLAEILEERNMSQSELAQRMGRPRKTINEIRKGKAEITSDTALQIELVLGTPARFWIERERLYREYLARKNENQRLKGYLGWLKKIPYRQMTKLGWLKFYEDKIEQLRESLIFFAVVSPEQWEEIWGRNLSIDFRKSQAFESDQGAITAWLRQGEIEASKINCADYNELKFRDILQQIRLLTVKSIKVFQPQMIDLCAAAGVALVFVPELPKTRVHGATRWLGSQKALIQLSDRYKTNDHFWFSFFHEAGHIVLHGKRILFLEGQDIQDKIKEKEADIFAANLLINSRDWQIFIANNCLSKKAINQFAKQQGIHPGIIVGRLQHEQIISYQNCNDLKEKYCLNTQDSFLVLTSDSPKGKLPISPLR
ncbi:MULTISPECIES: HigA family addiction module antitoxin [unclassified Microcystis]|uniref:HigA family addiction module antitoxin n=1 Tax=unclassified Microcystis TaxID=2643300 RepID=UPI00258E7F3A|nr:MULTISPECIES: HigA family addiction module antitoxin [unclassified Microcystis]MCA2763601.1 HigA family addiction module antidote protein [Microcystis sp. M151S2]MCA2642942.1 HigA family addiction module antidote protein [Microcystis sp. M087S2]MCA2669762.1 HigA family addiction module antidote protein [Microcystis sp. M080S2]MCA2689610.1 HigA family addiction module antidote protein [Microcystis sp. M037S2]MCA2733257.1 HigA family addiction module antidote protein [Microcystis sp. M158S2]